MNQVAHKRVEFSIAIIVAPKTSNSKRHAANGKPISLSNQLAYKDMGATRRKDKTLPYVQNWNISIMS
jgi:hypothetical protein